MRLWHGIDCTFAVWIIYFNSQDTTFIIASVQNTIMHAAAIRYNLNADVKDLCVFALIPRTKAFWWEQRDNDLWIWVWGWSINAETAACFS